ncbi:hypothetical protein SAMN05421788_11173 [Filimonas lacunae]|uniref:Lipoprotein n=1 Tax=Filimonas lacunae TaxID=477680 RepID=A0A173MB16_9BACT|nr:hypothetical protein [Filimonas lacunae]BAV04726.1 hypothetical protein FLA_0725 [Filimonas lacunae]SIT32271.1 hypothetical protein SAMN05421788_11173 [Filimonas lacunae]
MRYCLLFILIAFYSCYKDVKPTYENEERRGVLSKSQYLELRGNLWRVSPYLCIADTIGGYLHLYFYTYADTLDKATFKMRYMDNIAVSVYTNAFRNYYTGKIDWVYSTIVAVYHVYSIQPPFENLLYTFEYAGSDPLFRRIE